MRDPRFWLRKPQQSQGFRDVLQPCLVSIKTRAYHPYQTWWNIMIFATLTGAFRSILYIQYIYICQLWNKKPSKTQSVSCLLRSVWRPTRQICPIGDVIGSEETCTGRGSVRGWHLPPFGKMGSPGFVEVTSRMSVIHRRSTAGIPPKECLRR